MKPASAQSDHGNNKELSIMTHRICDDYLSVRQIRWSRFGPGGCRPGRLWSRTLQPLALAVIRLHVDGAQHQILF